MQLPGATHLAQETGATPSRRSRSQGPTRPCIRLRRCAARWASPRPATTRGLSDPPSARATADAELSACIGEIHRRSRETYGAPRVHAELKERGIRVGCKRVARPMRAAGLKGVSRRNWIVTTVRDRQARPLPIWASATSRPVRQSAVGGGYHIYPDLGRLPLPGRGARRLQPPDRGLGDGDPSAHRTGAKGARHGARTTTPGQRDSSFRLRRPIHLARLRQALPPGRSATLDGFGRRLLRQR